MKSLFGKQGKLKSIKDYKIQDKKESLKNRFADKIAAATSINSSIEFTNLKVNVPSSLQTTKNNSKDSVNSSTSS